MSHDEKSLATYAIRPSALRAAPAASALERL